MRFFSWLLKNKSKPAFVSGANLDTRPEIEREKDYTFEETVSIPMPAEWSEKPQELWRKFPIYNQNGSGSCVANSLGKLMGILYWLTNNRYVHFSPLHIYKRRSNKPNGGMIGTDAFDIARKGVTLEELVPSENMTDAEMDAVEIPEYKEKVGEVFKIGNYTSFQTVGDIELIASTIQRTGKGVMVWFFFNTNEWTDVPEVKDRTLTKENAPARHSVVAVDTTMYKGKKALIIEDSWGTSYGKAGQRVITEDFFRARNFFCAYPINFVFESADEEQGSFRPKYRFTRDLYFSPIPTPSDPDVIMLQKILQYEGLFPKNIDATGYYGAITAKSVLAWQMKHAVASGAELQELGGKKVGPKTRDALNALYPRTYV